MLKSLKGQLQIISNTAVLQKGAPAVPGRLNKTSVLVQREGVFYGQCSEICGVYHGFMPVVIEAVSLEKYLVWLDSQY